jgi:hypothetical protein
MRKSEINTKITNSQQTCIYNKFTFKIFLVLKFNFKTNKFQKVCIEFKLKDILIFK